MRKLHEEDDRRLFANLKLARKNFELLINLKNKYISILLRNIFFKYIDNFGNVDLKLLNKP